jgi:hypothetical protein
MSDIISIPLNKLVSSPRNVRKTGGESVEELAHRWALRRKGVRRSVC